MTISCRSSRQHKTHLFYILLRLQFKKLFTFLDVVTSEMKAHEANVTSNQVPAHHVGNSTMEILREVFSSKNIVRVGVGCIFGGYNATNLRYHQSFDIIKDLPINVWLSLLNIFITVRVNISRYYLITFSCLVSFLSFSADKRATKLLCNLLSLRPRFKVTFD